MIAVKFGQNFDAVKDLEKRLLSLDESGDGGNGIIKKIDDINILALEFLDYEPRQTLELAQRSYNLSVMDEIGYEKGKIDSLSNLSSSCMSLGLPKKALSYASEGLSIRAVIDDPVYYSTFLRQSGSVDLSMGFYSTAIPKLQKSLKIIRTTENIEMEALILVTFALGNRKIGNYDECIHSYNKALEIYRKLNLKNKEAMVLNNIAMAQFYNDYFEDAMVSVKESLRISFDYGLFGIQIHSMDTIGKICTALESFEDAHQYFQKSLKLALQHENRFMEMVFHLSTGKAFLQEKKFDSALLSLHQALSISEVIDARSEEAECHKTLSDIYKKSKEFEMSLFHFEKYHLITEFINNKDIDTKLKDIQDLYVAETQRNEAKIHKLENVELKKEITERKAVEKILNEKDYQQKKLLRAAHYLTESLDIEHVLTRISSEAKDLLRADDFTIYLLEPDNHTLTPVISLDDKYSKEILATQLDIDSCLTGLAIKKRKGFIINDPGASDSAFQIPGTPVETDEHLIVSPLIVGDEVLGGVILSQMKKLFTEDDLELTETFVTYVATALKNAKLFQKIQEEVKEKELVEARGRE